MLAAKYHFINANRQLHLREDREKEVGKRVIGNRVRGRLVRVDNLSYMTNWRTLKGHFSACGDIRRCDVSQSEDQRPVFGIVEYHDPESAERAILQVQKNVSLLDATYTVAALQPSTILLYSVNECACSFIAYKY